MKNRFLDWLILGLIALVIFEGKVSGQDYCKPPPFISAQAPPIVMLIMGRDHKLYYEAYNDASDIDEDGQLDVGYKHSINYYGYFDPYKCYRYDGSKFIPTRRTADKYCGGSEEWSGNFLNWLSMSRMDVLRKVLYGGYRSTDTSSETVLEGVFIPQDAHSWGKEYFGDDTRSLTPFDPPQGTCALPESAVTWDKNGKILFVIYDDNKEGVYGNNHQDLINSFSPCDYKEYTYLTELDTTNDYNSNYRNRIDTGNYLLVAEFYVTQEGTWQFAIDSDDGSEVEIDGTVVASYYGAHGFCWCKSYSGSINLTHGWHRIIVRLRENHGDDGVLVWYKKPGDASWKRFSASTLTIRAPSIDNTCRLKSKDFILSGEPASGGGVISCKRHLFCITSLGDGQPHRIRVLLNRTNRVWEWASKERPVCDNSLGTPDEEYFVRVKVCDPSVGLEEDCKQYPAGNYKPTGLLQKYGEGKGGKFCSKSLKPCSNDGDCGVNDGVCIKQASLYFGLITGSYTKNLSGGVLRKRIWNLNDEIDSDTGIFKTTIADKGSIIQTINRLRTVGFRYSDHSYQGSYTCGWITTRPLHEGECRMWGNPIGEMMYEAERYFAGKKSPTPDFTYSDPNDTGLNLPKPDWNDPYAIFPWCSKPSMIVISDINPSYDSDKVPGSYFSSYSGDISGLDVKDLADSIGNEERIPENPHFIGQSGSNYDFICSVKDVSELGESRGLCPEEPTKQGSYYSASIAYYGKTRFREDLNRPNIATYTVALSSPVPKIKIKLGNHTVTLVPVGKSVSGCINVYNYCARKCTLTYDSTRGLIIKNCSSNSYCPSNQIVDFYVTKISSNSGKFSINYEDVEQGADHDMDAIVTYEYKVIDNNHVKIKLSSDYAAGCIDQVMGFVISGTSEDGLYLPVRDKDSGNCDGDTPSVVCNMPLTWEHTFTVSDTPTATLLKNPLWYAAKWGGFEDLNNNNEPDLTTEWDKDGDGVPDNYFFVTNPLKLYEQLDKVFKAVLNRSGSAGAVATVTQEVLGEDIVIRGAFTTYEPTDPSTYVWKGHLEVYWPYEGCSAFDNEETCESISGCSWVNNQCTGTIYSFQLSENEGKFCTDSGFQGGHCWDAGEKLSNQGTRTIFTFISNQKTDFSFANVNNYLDLDSECDFDGDGNVDDNDKQKLVNWVVGTEDGDGTHMRNRNGWLLGDIVYSTPLVVGQPSLGSVPKVVAKDSCKALQPCFQYKNETDCSSHLNDYGCYWDRIDGTCEAMDCSRLNETVCNNQPVCQWDATEGVCEEVSVSSDSCFYTWRLKDDIAHRKKVAYVGANDGMLHAFLVGVWWDDPEPSTDSDGDGEADESHWIYNPDEPDSLCDGFICTGKEDIGQELWAYIPSNLLSELKELAKPTYGKEAGCQHKTMVDLSPEAWDVYMDLDNDGIKEWHTILIGGERGGGDVYFAIDVTDPEDPQVLWEFSTLRNMVYVSGSNGNYSADLSYLDKSTYDQIKTIAASWSNPYVGRIKIPDNYCFYSIPHIGPLDNNPSNLTALCYGGSQYPLSGWFAFIGGGIRVFDPSYELISGDNGAAYYPYFIVLDIKTGTNIFQFLWPLLRLHAGITTIHQNSNYIPYAVASPVALDIWDENGNIGQDGYMDHLYAGDLNGNFYGIKLNPSNNSFPLSLDIWNTKPISSSHVSDNYYRWTRQPITVTPTAAFDDNYNLMLYFGTGKFDDVVAGGYDDKTDRARMSFYALKDPSSAPSVLLPACQPIGSSPFTINCTLPSGITTIHGCSSFNSNCTWVKDDGTPDCCESNCSSSCYSCIYDFIEDGERVIDSALVAGGLVFVTTYVPSDDPCAAGGVGYLYVFDYMCRQLTENPFENADLQYEHLSQTGWTQGAPSGGGAKAYRANLGSGMPSKPVLDSGGEHVLIQTSDAKIHRIKVKLPQNPLYLKGWKEKE